MGPILYERYIKPYTEKQWGRPARTLSARWAPRRVSVRWDDDPYLFADPFQGWPAGPGGYTDLIDGLLEAGGVSVRTGVDVSFDNLADHMADADLVVLTCPLDVFAGERFGRLDWRGIDVRSVHVPHVEYAQGAMVVNQAFLRGEIGPERTVFAGRLANYLYIDMDDCMRQALDAAEGEVLPALRRAGARSD